VTNFAHELAAAVAEDPERPAVKLDDLVLTYGLLDAGAQRAAGLLRARTASASAPATASACSSRTSPTSPSSTSAPSGSARSSCR
jgi:hypothetical protein